jgi:hypothetical protein
VNSALYDAFHDGCELTNEHLRTAVCQTVPLSRTMAEQIRNLRDWAAGRARTASDQESERLRSSLNET